MYGFSPEGSETSMKSYFIYFTLQAEVKYDKKTKMPLRPKRNDMIFKAVKFVVGIAFLGLFTSFLYHFDFEPFTPLSKAKSISFTSIFSQFLNNNLNLGKYILCLYLEHKILLKLSSHRCTYPLSLYALQLCYSYGL